MYSLDTTFMLAMLVRGSVKNVTVILTPKHQKKNSDKMNCEDVTTNLSECFGVGSKTFGQ